MIIGVKEKNKRIEEANKRILREDENDEVVESLVMVMYMMNGVLDMAIESARNDGLAVSDGLKQHGLDFESELIDLRNSLDNIPDSEHKRDALGFYNELIQKVIDN